MVTYRQLELFGRFILRRAYILPTKSDGQLNCTCDNAVPIDEYIMLLVDDHGYEYPRRRGIPDGNTRTVRVSLSRNHVYLYAADDNMIAPSQIYQLVRNVYCGTLTLLNRWNCRHLVTYRSHIMTSHLFSTGSALTTSTVPQLAEASSTPAASDTSSSGSSSLASGAIAGIVIGSIFGTVLVGAVCLIAARIPSVFCF